jgi:hypothetical protein
VNQSTSDNNLILPLADPVHLFNAPSINPAFPGPLEGLGISGVDYLLGLLQLNGRNSGDRKLTLVLPREKAIDFPAEEARRLLRQHVYWRLEREHRELRITQRYGWRVAGFALITLAFCLAMSSIFASEMTRALSPLIRKTLEYGFEIIGWVVLWHPIDVLVFSPVAIRARITALRSLESMPVEVLAQSQLAADKNAQSLSTWQV